ncbi:MAG: ester cyclase [Candidatus Dormibacteria bacterium]
MEVVDPSAVHDRQLALVLVDPRQGGESAFVVQGRGLCQEGRLLFAMPAGSVSTLDIPDEALHELSAVDDELEELLGDAEYWLTLTVGSGLGEVAPRELIAAGISWPPPGAGKAETFTGGGSAEESSAGAGEVTGSEQNKTLVRRFYEEIDSGNLDAMDELVAEDYIDHNPPPFPGLSMGREGLKEAFKIFWDATPGHHIIEEQFAERDRVITRLTAVGTHTADLPGIPRTGNALRMSSITIHRIAGGRLAEKWAEKDVLGYLRQLGVLPTPPTTGA